MAQTKVKLYNMALSAVGADYSIAAVDDATIPAAICNLWYDTVRQTVLRAAHWNSAKRYKRLVKEAAADTETGYDSDTDADWQDSDPEPGFAFSYDLPDDMMHARYLTTYQQFSVGYENEGEQKIISCNIGGPTADDAPILCYTFDQIDTREWEPDLYSAVVYGLAGHIAMPLNAKPSRAANALQIANNLLMTAQANNANEMHQLMEQLPQSLQARGYDYLTQNRFVHPFGNLFTSAGATLT